MSRTASSSGMPSGMGSANRSAKGTAMASAWPPGRSGSVPKAAFLSARQTLGWPARHAVQRPHPMTPETRTRSPRRSAAYVEPDFGHRPDGLVAELYAAARRGVVIEVQIGPQMAVRSTVTMTPSARGGRDRGRSRP